MVDKKELVKLVSFFSMGDGGLYYSNPGSRNVRFEMSMLERNRDFADWACDVVSQITGCKVYEREDYNFDGYNRQPQVRVLSQSHPFLTTIRDRIYVGSYKSIDHHALKMLDGESLAILYMSDGCLKVNKGRYLDVTLNLCRLCYSDQFLLKKALKEKLDLEWNINRNSRYYSLRLRSKDNDRFFELVRPYILSSFQYKLPPEGLAPVRSYQFKNEQDGDIVRTAWEHAETGRNDRSLVTA